MWDFGWDKEGYTLWEIPVGVIKRGWERLFIHEHLVQ
jgi:hypothetical protein